jgi:hypothetical protein
MRPEVESYSRVTRSRRPSPSVAITSLTDTGSPVALAARSWGTDLAIIGAHVAMDKQQPVATCVAVWRACNAFCHRARAYDAWRCAALRAKYAFLMALLGHGQQHLAAGECVGDCLGDFG